MDSKGNQDDKGISLNKYISQSGICSRREADRWIESGRVKINGAKSHKGNRVFPGDKVKVDGRLIKSKKSSTLIIFNKPPGITCTTDRRDKTNIIDFIGYPERIFPIGRLDKPSTGLILLTNDGDLVNKILRKENNNEKEYIVSTVQAIDKRFKKRMEGGIPILGTTTLPCKVKIIHAHKFSITLTQGLNRQIRRMCEYLGVQVKSLKRVRIMQLSLGALKEGTWRPLTASEKKTIYDGIHNQSS